MPNPTYRLNPPNTEEGSVTDSDLLILAPWVIFAGGLITLMVLAVTRDRRRSRVTRRRARRRDH